MPRPQPIPPGPGQESVWEYPRPPRLERTSKRIEVWLGGVKIADTTHAYRVLETSHPPTYYLPRAAFVPGVLQPAGGGSVCEWKGEASYWALQAGGRAVGEAAWSYERPTPAFAPLAGHAAVYAGRVDECRVDGVRVRPQPGGFYGGWITPDVVGPFKGERGTWGW
ncbi:DUF427 domain-containing protein [Deinococcus hopiensis]|uniref:Uncharacterized conserved protein, DUF427 family n=1 Tax=Deinococcus hopiensis KR-140 TaxID=695939 RepID=A0A1W1VQZ1_9DEIO|nr:DUF427 domain-containing protein [Deinococcus hopiensis]SMB95768.1 Uncharacterized conserved protein, DUF427 family [Deinococcus hopiensis KR-140]